MHNHSDRGTYHDGCASCALVMELISDAGFSIAGLADASLAKGELVTLGNKTYRITDTDGPLGVTLTSVDAAEQAPPATDAPGPKLRRILSHLSDLEAKRAAERTAKTLAEQHYAAREAQVRRSAAVRTQRAQAHIDAAKALKTAMHHADVTIGTKATLAPAARVELWVGHAKPITLAKAIVSNRDAHHTGIGTALCRPGDTWNTDLGDTLAIGRALRSLGIAIEASALHEDLERSR